MKVRKLINKTDGGATEKPEARLTDMDVEFVSLVRAGANRQTSFMVVKRDAAKAVPSADASNEDKRAAQLQRADDYGIEAREDGALSYPEGDPTTESLYADPVNLKYPLGYSSNEPDPDRIRNALARFAQARDEYQEDTSKVRILERIVNAALRAGVDVSMPEDDPIYDALPSELKDRIEGEEETEMEAPAAEKHGGEAGPDGDDATTGNADLADWLQGAEERISGLLSEFLIARSLDCPPTEAPAAEAHAGHDSESEPGGEAGTTDTPTKAAPNPLAGEVAALRDEVREMQAKTEHLKTELAKARRALRTERARVTALKSTVGSSTAIRTGESPVHKRTEAKDEPKRIVWSSDLAAEAAQELKK
jgi:hypothetical protein